MSGATIQCDGVWRPVLDLDGQHYNVWRCKPTGTYVVKNGVRLPEMMQEFCRRKGRKTKWAKFDSASAFCEQLNKGKTYR